MPTYEYVCEKCGHRFEAFQSMTAPKLTDCPVEGCEGAVKRLLGTGAGVIFKGGGFYQTDYRSESYKKAAKQESEGAKSGEGKKGIQGGRRGGRGQEIGLGGGGGTPRSSCALQSGAISGRRLGPKRWGKKSKSLREGAGSRDA